MLKLEIFGFCDGTDDFAGVPKFRYCKTILVDVNV